MILTTGFVVGTMTVLVFVILVEKFPRWLKELVLGHYLASDLIFTVLALGIFPIKGILTLLSVAVVAVEFSIYLMVRRATHPWRRWRLERWRIQVIKGNRRSLR